MTNCQPQADPVRGVALSQRDHIRRDEKLSLVAGRSKVAQASNLFYNRPIRASDG